MKLNFQKTKTKRNQRGSVLVMCLVLAGLGTIGVAAWATLLDARTQEAEQNVTALERRVRFGNGKALAREVFYRKYLHAASGPLVDEDYQLADEWGNVTISAFTEAPLGSTVTTRINKTGAVPFRAFSLDVEVGVDDGDTVHPFTYQLKSYNPLLGGDIVYVHKNSETGSELLEVTGNLKIEGRALFWKGDYKTSNMTARTDAVISAKSDLPNLSLLDASNNSILPANFPFIMQTSGAVGGVADLEGRLNIVNNPGTPSNSYFAKVQSGDPGTFITISGQTVLGIGEGAAFNPTTSDEVAVQTLIANGNYTPANLAPLSPLSSGALIQILADSSLTPAEVVEIYQDNQPIPNDVMDNVINAPVLSNAQQTTILEGANYYAYVDNGTVFVNLNSPSLPNVLIVNAGSLEIVGQPDATTATAFENAAPRIIAVDNNTGFPLTNLTFRDQNKRRLILALHNDGTAANHVMNVLFTGVSAFPDWHMLLELEGLRSKWNTSAVGGVRIYGGIRTDQLINATSGTLVIRKETETADLELIASRIGWIETIRE